MNYDDVIRAIIGRAIPLKLDDKRAILAVPLKDIKRIINQKAQRREDDAEEATVVT